MRTAKSIIYTFTILCCVITFVSSFRILCYFPVPFHSHQVVFQILTEELARQGHELVVLTPIPHDYPIQNLTEINLYDVTFDVWENEYTEYKKRHKDFIIQPLDFLNELITPAMHKGIHAQMNVPEVQALIHDETQQFDVILIEMCVPLSIIFSAKFKAPVIQISSLYGGEDYLAAIGATTHPLIFPEYNQQKTWNLTFWEKVTELSIYIRLRYYALKSQGAENEIIKKYFGENSPTISELRKNIHMLLLNVHHIWDNNRPVPPSVVYLGALHLKQEKAIPKDLLTYLDASKNGVVYLSLGSKILFSDVPTDKQKIFFSVFPSLPYDFLIKWNGENMTDIPENVKLMKWLPQNDLLHHPKIKAFITQGGLQSADEAIAAKVPMIAIPIFGDQMFNAQKYVQFGIGKELDLRTMTHKDLREAILAVAEEKSYRENIDRLSRIMKEQRAGGLQKAVYWIEYVAEHGALHLRSPLADVSITDYLMLDVIGASLFVLGTAVVLLVIILRLCLRIARKTIKIKSE